MFGLCTWLVVKSKVWKMRALALQTYTGLQHELHQSLSTNGKEPQKRNIITPLSSIVETKKGDLFSLEFQTEGGHVSLAYRWGRGFTSDEKRLAKCLFVDLEVPASEGTVKKMMCNGPPWTWYEV